jgi:D-alanyl-D-alanine carboxypeptidase
MPRRVLALGLALLVVLVGAAGATRVWQRGDETQARLQRLADGVVEAGVPGTIVLLRDDSHRWSAASGVANRETGERVQSGDRFRIGSITKTMVAVLVLQLADEGKLHLDDALPTWLGGLVSERGITIRDLLAHTSGLADYEDERFIRLAPLWEPRRLARYAVRRPRLCSRDCGFAYASTNYVLLGLIVEKAGEAPLELQLRRRIFEPLRLRHTSFEPSALDGRYVHGYRASQHQGIVTNHLADVSGESAAGAWAAGAVVSTAEDVARFFAALLQGRLLRPTLLRAMRTPTVEPRRYGLGLAIFSTPCGKAWGHTGNINGHVTAAWNTLDASRQVVMFGNAFPLSASADATFRRGLEAAFCHVHHSG